jgi:hypothetical protein
MDFLLKFSNADELNDAVTGYIDFFSKETHTIYVPKLTMYWNDTTFIHHHYQLQI